MVGAEWQAGSFVTLLTWEPRRGRLLAARLVVVAAVGVVLSAALLGLFTLALVPTAVMKGSAQGVDGHWWMTYAGAVLRLSGITGLAAAGGAALAMIGKRTTLAVAAVFGYLVFGEIVLRLFWAWARPWLLLRNIGLVAGGEDLIPDGSRVVGALVVLAYAGSAIGAAFAVFSRRDFAATN
jgi:hypothetical protein